MLVLVGEGVLVGVAVLVQGLAAPTTPSRTVATAPVSE